MSNILGKKVAYAFGEDDLREEGAGTVIDKFNAITRIESNKRNEALEIVNQDIYMIEKDNGDIITIHPTNLIKVLK